MYNISLTTGDGIGPELSESVNKILDTIHDKLNVDGQEFSATDYGVGPVDAALNAIQKITSQITDEVRLKEYKLDSISGGANALCEVTVKVEDARGNIISSKSVGEDIVTTSVQAMVDGINRIMLKNLLKEKKI